uniref:(California timema) hypothetical protein n=2 Tax=Timema TaxID=61471 RepID=A0A7R9JEM4_TIMCA|nr:unnamed protein product [Timema californicum]
MGLAASYAGHVGLTAWRRKSTLLAVVAALVLLVLCLQYSIITSKQGVKAEESAVPQQRTLRHHDDDPGAEDGNKGGGNVQFVQSEESVGRIIGEVVLPPEQPSRDEVAERNDARELVGRGSGAETATGQAQQLQYEQQGLYQMGIPYANLDPRKPYIPGRRVRCQTSVLAAGVQSSVPAQVYLITKPFLHL